MRRGDIRVAVLRIEGTNCEQETHDAFAMLGARPEMVHLNQLVREDIAEHQKRDLMDYDVAMFPGGFSSGDYVRAGAIFGARIKAALEKQLGRFITEGRPVGGICNGFQVLVEMGCLPGLEGQPLRPAAQPLGPPQAILGNNDSSNFECWPTLLRHDSRGKCAFTGLVPEGAVLRIPSAHAEGKLLFPAEREEEYLKALEENDQVVFRYADREGQLRGYPFNPNGSPGNIAGICNPEGNVFGLMPHPERVFFRTTHPDWTRARPVGPGDEGAEEPLGGLLGPNDPGPGDGRAIFESVLRYVEERF
jgi:phosphoribosylformylglycinamidine synthase